MRHFEGVLGTSLEIQLLAETAEQASAAEHLLLAEIDRLELVFSRFLQGSELNQWQQSHQEWHSVSADLHWLLKESLFWMEQTDRAFHPGVDALTGLWKAAALNGRPPEQTEFQPVLEALSGPLWEVRDLKACKLSRLQLNFNGFAKGRIVDLACKRASEVPGVSELLVNIGGDLRHQGSRPIQVSIANPCSGADNLPAFACLQIQNQGLATSGHVHRGFQVGDQWHSHLIHPGTGLPVTRLAGVSVLADDSATADVLATAFSVLPIQDSLALADGLPRVGCLLIEGPQTVHFNRFWKDHVLSS
ncbi:FAD:protein FMN transferase [Deinococcus roseus]|uniref:FAD:protein FMN transferase n=1 Tax=Deinococcus roseus TaxID=392414 RepID=A0ABQ2CWV4_9DEIO|nr:FAD:protein FMN transferase [Deinococcus roseus]